MRIVLVGVDAPTSSTASVFWVGPKRLEQSEKSKNMSSRFPVVVYPTKTKIWDEPYMYISVDGETICVQIE